MFNVARMLLIAVFLEAVACLVILGTAGSLIPFFVIAGVGILHYAWRAKPRWAYGTARWANEDDLRRAGMIESKRGVSIGRLVSKTRSPLLPQLLSVFDRQVSSSVACDRFIRGMLYAALPSPPGREVVRLSKSIHTAVFGPTGSGKGVSFIVPWLLETDEPALVLDYKAENARLTAAHRQQKFGHEIVTLDPFCVFSNTPDCFNPIDEIDRDSPNALDDCRDLAEMLVVRNGDEREPHWNDSAESWIAAAIAAVALHGSPENRSLQTVRDVMSNPDKIPQLLDLLCEKGGILARQGGQLGYFRDKELSSTMTTANRHMRFLDTPAVAVSTRRSTFDPARLREGKMTVYCILPPQHMRTQEPLLRLWVGSLIRSVVRGGLQHG